MAKRQAAVKVSKATSSAKNAFERAIERARQSGLIVAGRGFRKGDFALVWMVPSQSEANRWHTVTQIEGQLECDCHAGQYGRMCLHRAVVFLDLSAEAQAFAARRQAQAEAETGVSASIGSARTLTADEQRATAPLARSNAPFSIFKA
jgi:hypothetical protein